MEGDRFCSSLSLFARISIHALRVEGDSHTRRRRSAPNPFLSTPSGWRATSGSRCNPKTSCRFLSTPSGWRATQPILLFWYFPVISIHALRVEGDLLAETTPMEGLSDFYPRPPGGGRRRCAAALLSLSGISIHALRVEGDRRQSHVGRRFCDFYPRPPGGGRRTVTHAFTTIRAISIHALRVEGD